MGTVILLLLLGLLLLILLGGIAFWFWRRRQAAETQPPPKKQTKAAQKEPTGQNGTSTAQESSQPATATTSVTDAPTSPALPVSGPAPPQPANNQIGLDDEFDDDKIRILIVDDNPDTRGHVSRLLYFEKDMEVIGQAINGRDGIEQAMEFKPHIVLMDINMPDMDGITATKEMSLQAPYCQVIIMSVQAEQHYMKQAMAAGARDFQPKPFTADELISCIRRVYDIGRPMYAQMEAIEHSQSQAAAQGPAQPQPGEGSAPIIAVYSPKGGIGTSAVAANLAVALQREYGDIVLMDGDLQFGDILVHLNTRPTRTISDLVHHDEVDVELLGDVVLAHNSGLKLLLAPPQPEMADTINPDMVGEIINGLKRYFSLIVVDTNSKLDDKTMTILDNADYILLVASPELPAVKSAKLFLELADMLEYGPDRLGVVINRANLPGGYSIKQIEKVLKIEHSYPIPYDPRMHLSINKGQAVSQQDPNAPAAQAIIQLARELWQKVTTPEVAQVKEAA